MYFIFCCLDLRLNDEEIIHYDDSSDKLNRIGQISECNDTPENSSKDSSEQQEKDKTFEDVAVDKKEELVEKREEKSHEVKEKRKTKSKYSNMENDELDKMLKWKNGVGHLPGKHE